MRRKSRLERILARIEQTPTPAFADLTPDDLALVDARERFESRQLRIIGDATEVSRFFGDEAARHAAALAELERLTSHTDRPRGRPSKVLQDLIILAFVFAEIAENGAAKSANSRHKRVAARLGPGLTEGKVKHAVNRTLPRLSELPSAKRNGTPSPDYSILVIQEVLFAAWIIEQEERCELPTCTPEAEACFGHVRKAAWLLETHLNAERQLRSAEMAELAENC